MKKDVVLVQFGAERARVYFAGGIGFDAWVRGVGWVVNDDNPSEAIVALAEHVQAPLVITCQAETVPLGWDCVEGGAA